MLFSDIIGLDDIKERLIGSFKNNHVAHAQLFSGRTGGGGLALALAFANYLNCTDKKDNDACGECASCYKNAKFIHPDLNFVFPVSPIEKRNISSHYLVEWRQFLLNNPYGDESAWSAAFGGENKQLNISREESRQIIQNLALKPVEGAFKIMLIWLPEYLNGSAANGILKILEEPPARTIFLLVSNNNEALIGTIRSRTQIFTIPPFQDDDVAAYLAKHKQIEGKRALQIAQMAEGNIHQANFLSTEMEDDNMPVFRDWMRLCFQADLSQMVKQAEAFTGMSKSSQKSLLQYAVNTFRETLIAFLDVSSLRKGPEDDRAFVDNFKKVMNPDKIEKAIGQLNQALYHLERNANARILFLDLSLEMTRVLRG